MVFEKKSPIDAFKRSGEIIKKTWGEAMGAYLGFGVVTTLAAWFIVFSLVGSIAASVSMETPVPAEIGGVVCLLALLVASIVSSCLSQIFQAALYIYATRGEVPSEFGDMLEQAFQAKKGRKWLLVGSR